MREQTLIVNDHGRVYQGNTIEEVRTTYDTRSTPLHVTVIPTNTLIVRSACCGDRYLSDALDAARMCWLHR